MNHYHTSATQELLSKFIDSIDVKLLKAEYRSITSPFYFNGAVTGADIIVGLNKGAFYQGKEILPMQEGSYYFIPRGQQVNAGSGPVVANYPMKNVETFADEIVKQTFTSQVKTTEAANATDNVISFVAFDTILYNSFQFFPLLNLPPLHIPPDAEMGRLMKEICAEQEQKRLGSEILLKNYTSELMVHLFRFINNQPAFEKVIEKLQYLTDVRLIGIVNHVRENLDKELTNATIAKVACVSDEYVGQFFKSLTGRTLQDYIESQRMERAMHLLKTIPNSVQEIAAMVGFRDAAYFSRRFRLHFNVNANVFRQGKNYDI